MKSIRLATTLCSIFCALLIGACNGDADVEIENDTDTTVVVPDTGNNTNTGMNSDTTGVGQEVKDESVEKMVEAALIAKPGYENVTVESKPDGVIVLNGTVASENEKAQAKVIAENTSGVKSVENNLTVKQ
jgi:osmotically-inducible protein OsmY